jgi:serine/threonine-protein kinase
VPEVGPAAELPATFGKYYLTEKLATGGMAEIYLAKLIGPNGFEKQLVIKQIHPRLSGQRQFVDLFVAEAKILVTLAHGNIVPVYELGVVDDTYFIAMEYIDGPTLYRLTEALARRDAVMAPPVAAWIAARVLEGLDYAHRKGDGVIHRDLSPRNVMLSRDGEVKLVDFGIAVARGGEGGPGEATAEAPTGSFPYMSPEQVRREALTGQSDLFSVGVLAWEMLVGQRLFARPEADATLAAVEGDAIARPSEMRPDVPAKLDEVVMRALARDRGERWESAGDMLAALNRYLYGLDETPGPREVAALVARYCPPETRRLATHAEAILLAGGDRDGGDDDADGGANGDDDGDDDGASDLKTRPVGAADDARPAAPHTAVIPRKRAPTRQQSFATHVALDELLDGGTAAATEVSAPPPVAAPTAESATPARGEPTEPVVPTRPREANDRPPNSAPPPGGALIVLSALAAIGLGGAAVYVFENGKAAVMRPDAMPKHDAAYYAIFGEAGVPVTPDAAAPTDAPATPPPSIDAAPAPPPIDAGHRVVAVDAGVLAATHPDAARPAIAASATLKIGADPWGDIVLDGVALGRRTPAELTVSAGHHEVKVIYSGDDPPQAKTLSIDVGAGEVRTVQADFRAPK